MKKLVLFITLAFIVSAGYAQNVKRTTAFNYMNDKNYAKAIEYIEPTITHPKTMNVAKTWFYRGTIYLNTYLSDDTVLKAKYPNSLDIAYESFIKAKELDEKEEWMDKIQYDFQVLAQYFYNEAAYKYNMADYICAATDFEKTYLANMEIGKYDTSAVINVALSSLVGKDYTKAEEYFIKLMDLGYNRPDMYSSMSTIYKIKGDTVTAVEYLMTGREKYPNNYALLIEEINIYLNSGKTDEAIASLEQALTLDTTNAGIYFAVGTNYEKLERYEDAINAYKKAFTINPDYADAFYNLGALYVNQAAEILIEANDLPLDETKKYNEMKEHSDRLLKASIPYLERSLELIPDERNALVTLKEIYTRLNMKEELEKINAKLN